MIDLEEIEKKFREGRDRTAAAQNAEENAEKKPKNANKGKVVGNYVLGRDLGKGTFGEVMVGTH